MFSEISLPIIIGLNKSKQDNNKELYSEEGMNINKKQVAKMKTVDLMLLRLEVFEVKK